MKHTKKIKLPKVWVGQTDHTQNGIDPERDDYADVTELDWAEYEFGTVEYDYNIHPQAARVIRTLFKRLYNAAPNQT